MMRLNKEALVTSITAGVTVVFIAFMIFPSNILEVFGGAGIVLLLTRERSEHQQFKIIKKEKPKK